MLSFNSTGDYSKTFKMLNKMNNTASHVDLDKYGNQGIQALKSVTPRLTGLAAGSWGYDIEQTKESITITWTNSDVENGCNVAILVQYGHATKSGGHVRGIDYINPAMKPIFDQIADDILKEVTN